MTLVVFMAAVLVLAVCMLLVLHPDYHAGLFGNTGLALIALAAVTRLAGILEYGSEVHITPLGVMLWIGLALFLGRHACHFLHRWATRGMDFREEGWGERMLRALSGEPDDGAAPSPYEAQRPLMLAWWLWFAVIVLSIAVMIMISGCAQAPAVPLCDRPQFELAVDEAAGRRLYALDEANMRALWAMVRGLATGTCRMPPAPGA